MLAFNIIATIVYALILVVLGYIGYRQTKNAKDFLLAGRKANPFVMAISYGAAFISTSAIVGFGGNAGLFGMSLLWLTVLNILIGVFIAFIFFGKRTRTLGHNLDANTFPELLGNRYQSRFIQIFSAVVIFLFMPIYGAAVLKGAVGFLASQFGFDYNLALLIMALFMGLYVSIGGLKSVMMSDAFQGIIMFIGMAFLLIFVYSKLGGITQAHQSLTDMMNDPVVQEQTAKSAANGFLGWTSMPAFNSPYWWSVVTSVVMGVGIGVVAQPQLVTRFMTVKSNRELNRAVVSGGVFILFMTGVAFVVGALSNVFFYQDTGMTAMAAAGGSADNIIPLFIKNYLPEWFGTIFLLTLLAAAMSTMGALFLTIGSSLGRDICEKGLGIKQKSVFITRIGIFVGIILSTLLAWLGNMANFDFGLIAQATAVFFGLCAATFLPSYIGAMYMKKASRVAAQASIVFGFITSFIWIFFIHAKNAKLIGLCKLLTGQDHLLAGTSLESLSLIDTIIITLPLSFIVFIVVNLLSRPKFDDGHLDKCYKSF